MKKHNQLNASLCLLVFSVAALSKFDVTLIARVPLGELLAFLASPFLILRGNKISRLRHRFVSVFIVLGIWALGIVLSDVFNEFIFLRFIRGFMKPLFCAFWMFFFIGIIVRDYRALIFYPIGNLFASLQNYFMPQAFTEGYLDAGGYEAVAFGLAPIVASFCLAIAVFLYPRSRLYASVAFLFSAAALIIAGAPRSAVAVVLLNAAIIFYIWFTRREEGRHFQLTFGRFCILSVIGGGLMLTIYYLYVYAATAGWLGELQYKKLVMQQDTIFGTNPLGLILGGRTYVFAAILGILDQPLLGHGSWTGAFMSDYYYEAVSLVGTNARDLQLLSISGSAGMAGHSVLFQGWLENGILTAIALLTIAYWVMREFLQLIQRDHRLTPWVVALTVSFFWAFFFSPFDVGTRITVGLFLAFHVTRFHDFVNTSK